MDLDRHPFRKREHKKLGREPSILEKAWVDAKEQASSYFENEVVVNNKIEEMPRVYRMPFKGLAICLVLAVFVYFFYTSYMTNLHTQYLSTTNIVNGKVSSACNKVQKPVTGNFIGDLDGNWMGQKQFSYIKSLYELKLSNFQVDLNRQEGQSLLGYYNFLMQVLYSTYSAIIEEYATQNNFVRNILLLVTLQSTGYTNTEGGQTAVQTFRLNLDPASVFDTQVHITGLSNAFGACNASASTTFSKSTYLLEISWDYDEYASYPECMQMINPFIAGYYSKELSGPNFVISIDVRTLMSAAAANSETLVPYGASDRNAPKQTYGSIYLNHSLTFVPFYNTDETVEGIHQKLAAGERIGFNAYDRNYPGMNAMYCFGEDRIARCFVPFGLEYFGVPYLDSFGRNLSSPSYCDCPSDTTNEMFFYKDNYCNFLDMLSGLIIVSSEQIIPTVDDSTSLGFVSDINRRAYEAAFYTIPPTATTSILKSFRLHGEVGLSKLTTLKVEATPNVPPPEQRKQYFDFCSRWNYTCSMLITNSYSLAMASTGGSPLNSNFYQTSNGSCTNSFMMPSFLNFINNPPTELYESYYSCTQDSSTAFNNAVGIAVANTSGYGPFVIIIFVNLLLLFQYGTGCTIPHSYTQSERDDAIKAWALGLLRVRDEQQQQQLLLQNSMANRQDVLKQVVKELEAQSTLDFYDQGKQRPVFKRHLDKTNMTNGANPHDQHHATTDNPMNAAERGIALTAVSASTAAAAVRVEILNNGSIINVGALAAGQGGSNEDLVGKKATQAVMSLLKEMQTASKLDFWVVSTHTNLLRRVDPSWLSLSSRQIFFNLSDLKSPEARALIEPGDEDDDEHEHASIEEEKKFLSALYSLLRLHISSHCGCSLFDCDDHFAFNKGYHLKHKLVVTLDGLKRASVALG